MANFRSIWNEVLGSVPRLPPNLAQRYTNRAWTDIRDARLWSWLVGVGYLTTPTNITAGVATTTLGSDQVVFSAGAPAALNAVVSSNPPLASTQLGLGRQFRLANPTTGTPGAIYNITAWDGISTMTLDRVYAEQSGSGQAYMVYKCYYMPPPVQGGTAPDFLRYLDVTNTAMGYTIRGSKLYNTQQQLDGYDAQRGSTGDAYIIASYEPNPTQATVSAALPLGPSMYPVHEWYPHPVYQRVYKCIFQKRMQVLSDLQTLPITIPENVLIARAMVYGGRWALNNVSTFPELAQTNWVYSIESSQKEYQAELLQCIKQDDEIAPQKAFTQGSQFDFPLGGQFLQSHDVSSLVGGNLW